MFDQTVNLQVLVYATDKLSFSEWQNSLKDIRSLSLEGEFMKNVHPDTSLPISYLWEISIYVGFPEPKGMSWKLFFE